MSLELWNKLSRPPKEALKQITGGRLNGKSDINPQWRMKAITEQFGPCGIGWKYEIVKMWREDASAGEVFAFVQVAVHVKDGEKWSDAIPGIGGSMLVAKEKSGLYNSDEGYKMATTDALSVAFKALGVAAEIYMGNWDGSKYKNDDTFVPDDDYAHALKLIETAPDMLMLQAAFTDAWNAYKGNSQAARIMTEAKDKRKRELS